MRLLFLAVLRPHTGNAVTAQRIRDHLEAAGHVCVLKDALDYDSRSEVAELIRAAEVEAALALHAYRAGRLLRGHGIPFGIVFGGTDLNEDVTQGEKQRVMGRVLAEARLARAVRTLSVRPVRPVREAPAHRRKITLPGRRGGGGAPPTPLSSAPLITLLSKHTVAPRGGGGLGFVGGKALPCSGNHCHVVFLSCFPQCSVFAFWSLFRVPGRDSQTDPAALT